MKLLLLPVCFAAVAASAAGLKDPLEVARDWKENALDSVQPIIGELNLRGTLSPPRSAMPVLKFVPHPQPIQTPRQTPRIDALSMPKERPDDMPPGAKPYQFEGRTYWIVPLATPTDS